MRRRSTTPAYQRNNDNHARQRVYTPLCDSILHALHTNMALCCQLVRVATPQLVRGKSMIAG